MAASVSQINTFHRYIDVWLDKPDLPDNLRAILVGARQLPEPSSKFIENVRARVKSWQMGGQKPLAPPVVAGHPPPAPPVVGGKPAPARGWSWRAWLLAFVIATHLACAATFVACRLGVQVACDALEILQWITLIWAVLVGLVNLAWLLQGLSTLCSWLGWLVNGGVSGMRWLMDLPTPHASPSKDEGWTEPSDEPQDEPEECVRREDLCKEADAAEPPAIAPEALKAAVAAAVAESMAQQVIHAVQDPEQQDKLQKTFDAYTKRMNAMEDRVKQLENDKAEAKRLQAQAERRLAKVEGRANETADGLVAHKRDVVQWKGAVDARAAAQAASIAGLTAVQGQQGTGLSGIYLIMVICLLALVLALSFFPYTVTPMAHTVAYLQWCKENPGQAAGSLAPRLGGAVFFAGYVLLFHGVYISACTLCACLVGMCLLGFFSAVGRESQELEKMILKHARRQTGGHEVVEPSEDETEAPLVPPGPVVNKNAKAKTGKSRANPAAGEAQQGAVETA